MTRQQGRTLAKRLRAKLVQGLGLPVLDCMGRAPVSDHVRLWWQDASANFTVRLITATGTDRKPLLDRIEAELLAAGLTAASGGLWCPGEPQSPTPAESVVVEEG